jgi:hypothetical protein
MPQPTQIVDTNVLQWSINEERRSSPRLPGNLRARCMPMGTVDNPPIWTAGVRDLSAYGIALVLPKGPGQSMLMEVELLRRNGVFVRTILARVVHEERESSQSYLVGCAFVRELEDQHLRFFQASAVHPTRPDCRRWTRYPCNVETVCYTSDTAPGERRSGRILNISAGGIALMLRCEFSQGTLLHFELPQELNMANPNVLVRVVRVMGHSDGNWTLGCEFADHLNEDDFKALVR